MPNGSQFQARGNRRRDTVTPAPTRPRRGLSPLTPGELLSGVGDVQQGTRFGSALQFGENLIGAGLEATIEGAQGFFGPKLAPVASGIGAVGGAIGSGIDFLFGQQQPSQQPTIVGGPSAPSTNAAQQVAETLSVAGLTQRLQNVPLPLEARASLEQARTDAQTKLDQIAADLEVLTTQEQAIQQNFDTGGQFLQALGLPATVSAAREDPQIDKALTAVNTALQSGDTEGLDAAIDALASVGEADLQALTEVFGREQYLGEIQTSIRNNVHNLVQNRQNIEAGLIDYEQWLEKEAQAQELNLWDFQGDPTSTGRGYDTVINDVEPWLEINFNGVMSPEQWQSAQSVLSLIWATIPSREVGEDPETGEAIITGGGLSPDAEAMLMNMATTGDPANGIIGLGFTQAKAADFVDQVRAAVTNGQQTALEVEEWRKAEFLQPGTAPLGGAIYEVAEDIYDDPETAELIAKSDFIHRLILMRSGGDVNFRGGGNQFGLGGLPEHTYEQMGYEIADLEGNPELQLEALLTYIGYYKYGPGYEGLQAAVADYMHNPDMWGEL